MAKVHEIRKSIDTKLDRLEAGAAALEAQLDITKDKALERLESQKKQFSQALDRLKAEIEKSKTLAADIKAKIVQQVDHLKVQLALGKAEAKDAYEAQKEKIGGAIASFQTSVEREVGEVSDAVTQELVAAENALDAELDAVAAQFEIEKARQQAQFEQKKKELTEQIHLFKNDLKGKREKAGAKADTFEGEFSAGLEQIKKAFSNLLS